MPRGWILSGAAALLLVAGCRGEAKEPAIPLREEPPAAADVLPHRVWWRYAKDKQGPHVVAASPGGDAIPGEWQAFYFCGEDGIPSTVFHPSARGAKPDDFFHDHFVWIEPDGVKWWLFSRARIGGLDPGFTEEQRRLVGRWKHRDDRGETEVELLEGGVARAAGGERWEWISAGSCLELRRPYSNGWLGLNCILAADGRTYARVGHDGAPPDVSGERIDARR